ncbi:uncharacterized protein AFUA_1G13120 [Aspergillus fumigatus Af293]|uniref:Uncharacterized protein n=2 Tax=Aspergillus fumigatus TaxID=746128 RepID=Q4WSD8_ASPFU|nr:conserved hypothetical protein [Aspergillus fumigatus Af293]EAL90644.1 conserved hypothetical protein [Aspergillus fumigatus Af293]EDP56549.1 conserved hypothetical protein [Aspergillus fumigatus A1163]
MTCIVGLARLIRRRRQGQCGLPMSKMDTHFTRQEKYDREQQTKELQQRSYLRGTSPIAMNIAQRRRIEMLAWSTHSLRPVLEKKVRINTGTMFQYLLHGLLRLTDRKSMSCQAPKNFIHRRDEIKQSTFLRLWMQKAPVPGGG